jgi:hypothetical protein
MSLSAGATLQLEEILIKTFSALVESLLRNMQTCERNKGKSFEDKINVLKGKNRRDMTLKE